jgi:hippurate hydrolase
MTVWTGTATLLAQSKDAWSGTLVMIGQPAEEQTGGARAMLADKLYERFPRPDYVVALHVKGDLAAGVVGWVKGYAFANVDSVDVTLFGRGGHGAAPHTTVDPIAMAAKVVLSLQTLVSREMNPIAPAVVTVGSIHGGTRHNIIPDEVKLQLTVRSFTEPVRMKLLAAIDRIAKAEAQAAGAAKMPTITRHIVADALSNDPALTARVQKALLSALGPDQVKEAQREMISEDFTEFSKAGVPSLMLRIGAVPRAKFDDAMKNDTPLPSLHSSAFAPDAEPTIKAAIAAEVLALRELLH